MLTIKKSMVPSYLRSSELYNTLEAGDAEDEKGDITIPIRCCKLNESIDSSDDLLHYANTIRYWGVPGVPLVLIERLLVISDMNEMLSIVGEFGEELVYLKDIVEIRKLHEHHRMKLAIKHGRIEVVDVLFKIGTHVPTSVCDSCAEENCPELLEYFHTRGISISGNCAIVASKSGSVGCLKYIDALPVQVDGNACILEASKHGFVDCVKHFLDKGVTNCNIAYVNAATFGNLAIIKLLHEYNVPLDAGSSSVYFAAINGHWDCVEYLRDIGGVWSAITTYRCAYLGNIDHLRYVHEHGCPWDFATTEVSGQTGHMDCLQYAHQHGCPWHPATTAAIASNGQLECLQYAHEHGCPWDFATTKVAGQTGHMNCLQYAHQHGCPWHPATTAAIASNGQLECLQYAHEHGCPWDPKTAINAAREGQLTCLQYIFQLGFLMNSNITHAAAENGQLECLRWAHEQGGCPLDAATCTKAIVGGSYNCLVCLKYALQHGCQLDENLLILSVQHGDLKCTQCLVENPCPWSEAVSIEAVRSMEISSLRYIVERGCPCGEATFALVTTVDAASYLHLHGCAWTHLVCVNAVLQNSLVLLQYATEHGCPWSKRGHSQCVCKTAEKSSGLSIGMKTFISSRTCGCRISSGYSKRSGNPNDDDDDNDNNNIDGGDAGRVGQERTRRDFAPHKSRSCSIM